MDIKDILTIVITVASFLLTCLIPTVIVMINRIKALRKAKTEAEREKIINEIIDDAQGFVVDAENLYKDIDALVKGQGKTCGAVKKDSVMTKIQDVCIVKGIAFDKEFWSKKVDDLVALTRKVNAK